jgi:hypothetical protein
MIKKLSKKKAEALRWHKKLARVLPLRGGMKVARDSLMQRADLGLVERIRIRQSQYNAQTNGKWAEYQRQWSDQEMWALHRSRELPEWLTRPVFVRECPLDAGLPIAKCLGEQSGAALVRNQPRAFVVQ